MQWAVVAFCLPAVLEFMGKEALFPRCSCCARRTTMRILRLILAAAMVAAPIVAYTIPPAAYADVEDASKNDAQILKDVQNKLKNKRFSGIQVAVQSGVVTLSGSVPLYADKQDADKNAGK